MTSLFSRLPKICRIIVGLSLLWSSSVTFAQADQGTGTTAASQEATAKNQNPLVAHAQLKDYKLNPGQSTELKIFISLPTGYKAYEDQFKVRVTSPEGFKSTGLRASPVMAFFDKTSKKMRKGVVKTGELLTLIEAPKGLAPGDQELLIELTYQACTENFCLFPQITLVKAPFFFVDIQTEKSNSSTKAKDNRSLLSLELSEVFARGLLWTFIFVFIAGVLTSFTPCIFPMIPITLSVLGRNAHTRTRWQNFFVSNLYVLGIAITYSVMGVVAASTGALFGSFMSHPVVLSIMCLIFFAMALSMFGVFELQPPAFIQNRFSTSDDLTGYSGAFFSGIISGVVASPCVGPVLVGILTYIAKTQNLFLGFFLMFTYALGMGQIFLVLGVFSQFAKLLPKSGPWLDGVKNLFGILMIGACYYFLSLLLPTRAWDISLGIGFIIGSAILLRQALQQHSSLGRHAFISINGLIGLSFLATGAFDLRPQIQTRWIQEKPAYDVKAMSWLPYSEQELARAKSMNKPVIVDFNAEWCAACKELDQYTFTNQRFQLLSTQFVLMKYDATNESPELEQLRKQYDIVGLPTVLFFDKQGHQLKDLTLTAFEEADAFIERMSKALN